MFQTSNTGSPANGERDVQGALQMPVLAGQVEPVHGEGEQPPGSRWNLSEGIPWLGQVPWLMR